MKPLLSRTEDSVTLQDLGRASVQIVHDLKNQLNGLKLYATFLRKRLEKADRASDELDTLAKLIGGLDRAAGDLSTIVEYGRPVELKKQPGFDIQKVMRGLCSDLNTVDGPLTCETDDVTLAGDFDPSRLSDALKWISIGTLKNQMKGDTSRAIKVRICRIDVESQPHAVIEWMGTNTWDHDPFRSFAGSDEIRMSLAAKIIEAHDGAVSCADKILTVTLPISG